MDPLSKAITIIQGATFRQVLWVGEKVDPELDADPEAGTNWAPADLTGAVGASQARSSPEAPDPPLLTFDVIIDGPAGKVTHELPPEASSALPSVKRRERIGWYDVKVSLPGGDGLRVAAGRVSLDPEITR